MGIRVTGLSREINLLEDDAQEEFNRAGRRALLGAFADLRIATPVDTGRARNSWDINTTGDTVDAENEASGSATVPQDLPATMWITNGAPHIGRLNEGSSAQAPTNFIESALLRNFDDLDGEF